MSPNDSQSLGLFSCSENEKPRQLLKAPETTRGRKQAGKPVNCVV